LNSSGNSTATVLRFGGFELDYKRAELRRPDGKAIKLRPKTFDMLALFAANAGQLLSKQKLMETVWPNVRVGEDNLFQCIRELRSALGDDQRQLIKLVSGRGYLFDAEMSTEPADKTPAPLPEPVENRTLPPQRLRRRSHGGCLASAAEQRSPPWRASA
jgi:DNA-binding winged helix-turn-helix (wHTH) protein